jgi:hypothetical protein
MRLRMIVLVLAALLLSGSAAVSASAYEMTPPPGLEEAEEHPPGLAPAASALLTVGVRGVGVVFDKPNGIDA